MYVTIDSISYLLVNIRDEHDISKTTDNVL